MNSNLQAAENAVRSYLKRSILDDAGLICRWKSRISEPRRFRDSCGDLITYRGFKTRTGGAAIRAAKIGNQFADKALRELARELMAYPVQVPQVLTDYVSAPFNRPANRPIAPAENVAAIRAAVAIAQSFGICRTRSKATRDKGGPDSACSLVARLLEELGKTVTEDAIEKITNDRKKPPA